MFIKSLLNYRTRLIVIAKLIIGLTLIVVMTQPAFSGDVWDAEIARLGLNTPHGDDCATDEAFVTTTPDGRGFCLDIDERTGINWPAAKNDCLQDNKRLPEASEWYFACLQAGTLGLNDMTNNWEWVSNDSTIIGTSTPWITIEVLGDGSCSADSWGNFNGNFYYRCLR